MSPPALLAAAPREFDVAEFRRAFPALHQSDESGQLPVFFDGPAGSQTPQRVVDAIANYLITMNANHGGVFATSRQSDAMLAEAHAAVADLLGADDPSSVIFGANMTTLTFAFSRALSRGWQSGDEIIVTHLDHDANVSPWVLAARDAGVTVRRINVRTDDCTLDLDHFRALLSKRTRLVAVGAASNAVGTINPIGEMVQAAHASGAEVFVDAVHYAPHRLIDVRSWDCDYLACSAYKFFGPHVGVLWGRPERLAALTPYKVRPAADSLPERWMTGTQNHEGIAGVLAAVEYLADLGRQVAGDASSRRAALCAAFAAIKGYEESLTREFLAGLKTVPQVKLWGIADADRVGERVPTFGITHDKLTATELAEFLADRGIYVWNGNFYALPLTEYLGLEPEGMVRIGLLHYNTSVEVERLLVELREVTG